MNIHSISNLSKSLLLLGCFTGLLTACSDDDETLSGDVEIKEITLGVAMDNVSIDHDRQTIMLQASQSVTDFSNVPLNFTLGEGAEALLYVDQKVKSGDKVDLTDPLPFTVVAPDGSRSHWMLTATNNAWSLPYGLGYVLTEGKSNQSRQEEEGRTDFTWYCNQYESTNQPANNCGPACAAMAILWGNPRAEGRITVDVVRSCNSAKAQWANEDIQLAINVFYGMGQVRSEFRPLPFDWSDPDAISDEYLVDEYAKFIKNNIDEGCIMTTVVANHNNTYNTNPEGHTGRYYTSDTNHIMVFKGYKVVDGVMWVEAYDPGGDGAIAKYADGSWKGQDRYYNIADLAQSIREKKIGIVLTIYKM